MKAATINGKKEKITRKCGTDISMLCKSPSGKYSIFSGDVYTVDDCPESIVLVAVCGRTGSDIKNSTTVITKDRYESISDLHNPYDQYPYWDAIMSEMGFS